MDNSLVLNLDKSDLMEFVESDMDHVEVLEHWVVVVVVVVPVLQPFLVDVVVDNQQTEDRHLASLVEADSDTFVAVQVQLLVEPVDLVVHRALLLLVVEHHTPSAMVEPFVVAVVVVEVSLQSMDKEQVDDVEVALHLVVVLVVALVLREVAYRRHYLVLSSFVVVVVLVEVVLVEDSHYVDNPFQDYCRPFVH